MTEGGSWFPPHLDVSGALSLPVLSSGTRATGHPIPCPFAHTIFRSPQGPRRWGKQQGTRREAVTRTHPSCPWRPCDLARGSGHTLLEPRMAARLPETQRPPATLDGRLPSSPDRRARAEGRQASEMPTGGQATPRPRRMMGGGSRLAPPPPGPRLLRCRAQATRSVPPSWAPGLAPPPTAPEVHGGLRQPRSFLWAHLAPLQVLGVPCWPFLSLPPPGVPRPCRGLRGKWAKSKGAAAFGAPPCLLG